MATPPGLFYAYAKYAGDDWSDRHLIVFASRAVADEWWRAITDSVQRGYTRFNQIVRHTGQFYTFSDKGGGHIQNTMLDKKINVGANFMNTVFFTLLDDRGGRQLNPAPVLNYTDHRSGNRFFIRSMLQPEVFWFFDRKSGLIRPSKNRRTRTIVDEKQRLGPNTIMISTDSITIAVGDGEVCLGGSGDQARLVVNQRTRDTHYSATGRVHKFSDFDGGFEVVFNLDGEDFSEEDFLSAGVVPASDKTGEKWELV